MTFETIKDELEHIQALSGGELNVDAVLDYAKENKKTSLVWAQLPSKEGAWQHHCKLIIRNLIRVHIGIVPMAANNPVRLWVSESQGTGKRTYTSTEEVLSDPNRRNNLLVQQIKSMLAIYNAYKFPELHEIAELLEGLLKEYAGDMAA